VTLRIGNAAGFLGDNLDAPRRLVESAAVDVLTLEHLAELTMSILARLKEKDPQAGYASDFITELRSLLPALMSQPALRIVTNAGGVNPLSCAQSAGDVLARAGLATDRLGVITGDDLLPRLAELQAAGCDFSHLDTGQPLAEAGVEVVAANAYLGAQPIAHALQENARYVISGRVADASLTVGPAVHHFGWDWHDFDRLAGASVAGHLIECGPQVTGGFYTHWSELDLADVGYPIAELDERGDCVLTKPPGSGGAVHVETVCEQLVYEVGDPRHYLTPDVDVDFTSVSVTQVGADRVAVRGAKGDAPPATLKVSLAYRAGFTAWGQILIYGRDCRSKAHTCAELVRARLRASGCDPQAFHAELLGDGFGVPGGPAGPQGLRELVLRLSVQDPRREIVERFLRELAPLAVSGPAGLAGYTTAAGSVRPVYAYWPTLVPRELVTPRVQVRTAAQWAARE
jgi:hypothetical protein